MNFIRQVNAWRKRSRAFSIVTLLECIALLFCILLYVRPMESADLTMDSDQMPEGSMYMDSLLNDPNPGWYIDNSIEAPEDGIDMSSVPVDLHFGSFIVTLDYATSDETNICRAESENLPWTTRLNRSNMGLDERLDARDEEYQLTLAQESDLLQPWQFTLFSLSNIRQYRVIYTFKGNGYLYCSGIHIRETYAFKNMVLLSAVLFYLLFLCSFTYIHGGWRSVLVCSTERVPSVQKEYDDSEKTAAGKLITARRMTVFICLCIWFLSSLPLTDPYLIYGHDLGFHIARIEALRAALADGQFPVRVSYLWLNHCGYASSIFYNDLFLLFPALLRMLGMSMQTSYKCYVLLINGATIAITYWCWHRITGNRPAALVGMAAYVLAPYRLNNVYLRAAAGEYTAMTFLPLVMLGMVRIYQDTKGKREHFREIWSHSICLILGLSGIISSHVLTCLMVGMLLLLALIVCWKRTFTLRFAFRFLTVVLGCLMLNAWFWVPFLDYYRDPLQFQSAKTASLFGGYGVYPGQMFETWPEGTGNAHNVVTDLTTASPRMSLPIGLALVIGCLLWIAIRILHCKTRQNIVRIGWYCAAFGILCSCLACIWFPWDVIDQLAGPSISRAIGSIQLPWRFLGMAEMLFSLLVGCDITALSEDDRFRQQWYRTSAVGLAAAILAVSTYQIDNLNKQDARLNYTDDTAINMSGIMGGEYLPRTENGVADVTAVASAAQNVPDTLQMQNIVQSGGTWTAECINRTSQDQEAAFPIIYYRYYNARSSGGQKLQTVKNAQGGLSVILPASFEGTVTVRYQEPVIWRLAELISLLAAVWLLVNHFRFHRV